MPTPTRLVAKPTLQDLLNALIDTAVRSGNFNIKAQTQLLYSIASEWPRLPKDVKQQLRARIVPIIPRLTSSAHPENLLNKIIDCYTMYPERGATDIAKCLKADLPMPVYKGDPDEYLFPKTGWIAEFIKLARESEVPIAFHFWSAVTVIGASCKFKVMIDRSKFDLRLNWYTMLVGSKATGKSLSKDIAEDIVNRLNRLVNPVLTTAPGAELRYGSIRLLAEDSTKESIMEELAHELIYTKLDSGLTKTVSVDSAGLLLVDELANLLGRQSFAVETKIPFFTALYASRNYRKSTVTSTNVELRNCALSMLACCAPDWLLESITPIMFRGGFLDRFRIIFRPDGHSTRSYPTPGPSDPVMCNILAEALMEWAALEEELELLPTKEAEEFYTAWYHEKKYEIENEINPDGLSLHRLANQLWKLAGILCISDATAPYIGVSHLDAANSILVNEEKYVRHLMQVITQDPLVSQLEEIERILLKSGGVIEKQKLHGRLRRRRGFMPFSSVGIRFISELVDNGNITMETYKSGVRGASKAYYKLTEIGLNHLSHAGIREKQVNEARINIKRHTNILDSGVEKLDDSPSKGG